MPARLLQCSTLPTPDATHRRYRLAERASHPGVHASPWLYCPARPQTLSRFIHLSFLVIGEKSYMAEAATSIDSLAAPFNTRVSEAKSPDILAMQNLIKIQLDSFEWFKREGLKHLFAEISPISDFTGRNLEL